jgi:hypothetical protein
MDTLHELAGKAYYGDELHIDDINGTVERIGKRRNLASFATRAARVYGTAVR